jgi:glucose-1-phosphate adenylyltransferase
MDYRDLIGFHRKSGVDFTVSVITVGPSQTGELGILKLGRNNRITAFKEKPLTTKGLKDYRYKGGFLASMGVYIFKAKALMSALETKDADFGKEVIPHSIRHLKGASYIFDGYWQDVGTIKSFYEANMGIADRKEHFSFFYSGSLFTRPRFLPSARIVDSRIRNSVIAEGSFIKDADIKDSIVGLRSIIGKRCRISRTVIMGADYYEGDKVTGSVALGIEDGCEIDKAIIDKNARIGRGAVIKNEKGIKNFDGDGYFIRDGIVIITKNSVIKDFARI